MFFRTGGFLTGKLMIVTGQLFLHFQSSYSSNRNQCCLGGVGGKALFWGSPEYS